MYAEQALLLDRTRYRRYDPTTNKTYHLAESGALSPAIKPLTEDGTVDTAVLARYVNMSRGFQPGGVHTLLMLDPNPLGKIVTSNDEGLCCSENVVLSGDLARLVHPQLFQPLAVVTCQGPALVYGSGLSLCQPAGP